MTSNLAPMAKRAFSAVLLAGGKSSRMGRDKAGVLIGGEPLWMRQIATLRALEPGELFISGQEGGPYANEEIEILQDLHPGSGPLAGLEAALHRTTLPYLVVLAIDLPEIRPEFLSRLLWLAIQKGRGVVPYDGEWFEPLAAVYSSAMKELAGECLRGDDHSMQYFVRRAMELDLAAPYLLSTEEQMFFRNLNEPGDLI